MTRLIRALIVLSLFAVPLHAQTSGCSLGISVSCATSGNASDCTATTTNSGTSTCSGFFETGFEAPGSQATLSGVTTGLSGLQCFDSSIFPTGFPIAVCFGDSVLHPQGSFTQTVHITGSGPVSILAFTSFTDTEGETNPAFVYAFSNATPLTCTPTASAPSVTQSGLSYTVNWSAVTNPQTTYQIDESTVADFSTIAKTQTVSGLSATFSHPVTSATAFFYRVRATNCGGGAGPFSSTVSTVVQPQPAITPRGGDAVVPFGSTQPATLTLNLAPPAGKVGALDNTSFTTSTDKPYLTVTPASGTIPPGGTKLTVTADPTNLPPGANTGTVTVITSATTVTVPVSISLVTPVGPGGKSLPPGNALIIPVVAHVNGANSPFFSDVRLTNAASSPVTYQLNFTPTRSDGTKTGKNTSITVAAAQTIALNDIVNDFFGLGATGNTSDAGSGSLEIRPVNSSSLLTYASSRTYAVTPKGSLGQFVAAIPFSRFIGPGTASPIPGGIPPQVPRLLSLQQIAESAKFRTNLGLTEGSGSPASGTIRIINDAGAVLKSVPYSLQPGEHQQLNGFLATNGIALDDGRIEVTIDSATGAVSAYASVVDNLTSDPLAVMPAVPSQFSATRYVLPGVAELNSGSNFHSDIRLYNGGSAPATVSLTYFPQQNVADAKTAAPFTIAPGEVKAFDNVLPTLFGVTAGGGSVLATTATPSSLVASGRTYSRDAANGTFGQFIPGVIPVEGVGAGDRPLQILQLEQSPNFRTNVGIVELTGNPVKVRLTLYLPDSVATTSTEVDLQGNEFRQFVGILGSLNAANTYNGRITVSVVSGSGKVTAYGSVIDRGTEDPTYVPAQ